MAHNTNSLGLLACLAIIAVLATSAGAADSPRFRGPQGDGCFSDQGLMREWPETGPPLAWEVTGLGQGYSSAAVAQDKAYVTGMLDEETGYLFVIDKDGKFEQRIPYGKETTDGQATGPRSTPTIDGTRAYLLSGLGVVYCIDVAANAILWQVDILDRFQGENIVWTLAESLLLDGDRIICTPGGKLGGLAALDKMTGETIWATQGVDDAAGYCSAGLAIHNGRRILLTETAENIVCVDADSGQLLWKRGQTTLRGIHAVTPLYKDGLVYYSGGYRAGGGALELSPDASSFTEKWTDKNLDCQHHGVVLVDGYLYGTSHASGLLKTQLMCLEMTTGRLMWNTEEVLQAAVVYADGMLYTYEGPKSGIVSLVTATPAGFERKGAFVVKQGTGKHWAHPTIANQRLYIRHGDSLLAYELGAQHRGTAPPWQPRAMHDEAPSDSRADLWRYIVMGAGGLIIVLALLAWLIRYLWRRRSRARK